MYHSVMHATVSSPEMAGGRGPSLRTPWRHLDPNKGSDTVLATGNCIYIMPIYEVRCNNMV